MEATRIGWKGETLEFSKREKIARQVGFAAVCLAIAGLVTSPALISIGTVLFMLASVVAVPFPEQLRRYSQHIPALLFSLLFALQVVSGVWTRASSFEVWRTELLIKLPYFLGTYAFAVLGPFSVRQVRIVWAILLLGVTFVGTGTVLDYIINADVINERIKVSKEVEVWLGCNHIYFSVTMAFALMANIWSIAQPEPLFFRGERWLFGAIILVDLAEMHVLTTRTGLVGLYLTALIIGWMLLLRQRRYLLAVALAVALAAVPVIGYYSVPSFKHRIENTKMDLGHYFTGGDPNYLSIGTRIESWKTAIHLWQKHPLIGVGMADLKADMTDQYVEDKTLLCPENFQMPHNQFLQNLAGWGILGFLILAGTWFFPILSKGWPKDLIFWLFWVNFSIAMMGESMMERQVGVCLLLMGFMLSLGASRMLHSHQNA